MFAEHLNVLVYGRSHAMPEHRTWAPRIIEHGIEHPLRVRREACSGNTRKHFGQFLTGFQIANAVIVAFVAFDIHAVQHPPAVFADIHAADTEEVMPFGFGVGVEHDLFARHAPRLPHGIDLRRVPIVRPGNRHTALHRILLALLRPGEIPIAVHARRHRHIGFLHMGFQLVEQCVAQRRQRLVTVLAQTVLRRNILLHFRRLLVAHPLIGVDECVAVMLPFKRHLLCYRHVSVPTFGHSRPL